MFCPKCGNQCEDGVKFCPKCGANLEPQQAQPNYQQPPQPQYQPPQQGYQQPNYQQPNYQQPPQQGYQQPNYQQPPYQQPVGPTGMYKVPIKNRSIALCIILSIVTCGIYGIYWMIVLVNDLNLASGRQNDTSGGVVFLLSIVTCGIYGLVWLYKAGEKVGEIRRRNGEMSDSNSGVIYLVLSLFGLGIVSYCLIQSELNKVASIVG